MKRLGIAVFAVLIFAGVAQAQLATWNNIALPTGGGGGGGGGPMTGEVRMWAAAAAPSGWYALDGSCKSETTDAALYAVIGNTWTTADSCTAGNFGLPDARGRTPIGAGTGTGLTARALGATGGAETHAISAAEMPSHTHSYTAPSNSQPYGDYSSGLPVNVIAGTGGATTGGAGSGAAMSLMQPFLSLIFIIKN
jgi:microcystin-dependent protein